MADAIYILALSTWAFLIIKKKVRYDSAWHEVFHLLVKLAMAIFLIYYGKEIATAFVYVMTNSWCAIVYPFTQVCKG